MTPSQPQQPTPPPYLDQRGKSSRTPLPAHLQLGLESNLSTKVLGRLTQIIKQGSCAGSTNEALGLTNYCISMSSLDYHLAKLINVAHPSLIFSWLRV